MAVVLGTVCGWVFSHGGVASLPNDFPVPEGLRVFLDGEAVETDGAGVVRMKDRSGSGNDAGKGKFSVGGSLLLPAATPSGKNAVRFSGAGDYLEIGASPECFDGRGKTTLVVFRPWQLGLRRMVNSAFGSMNPESPAAEPVYLVHNLFASPLGDGTLRIQNRSASDGSIAMSTPDGSVGTGIFYIGVNLWKESGESVAAVVNESGERFSSSISGATAVPQGHLFTRIGAGAELRDPEPAEFFHGDIATVVIYNRELTEEELSMVEGYLFRRYLKPFDPLTAYGEWIGRFDLPEALRSPEADANGDGLANLLNYAFSGNPLAFSREAYPSIDFETVDGGRSLSLLLPRNPEARGLEVWVESSRDLVTWKSGFERVDSPDDDFYRFRSTNVTDDDTGLFLRARVSFEQPDRPILEAAPGLFDPSDTETLGLDFLSSDRTEIYVATEDNWTFSHTPNLVVFQEALYLMWSNGIKDEDDAGQRILYTKSEDGVHWTPPAVLATPEDLVPGNANGSLMSSGWHVRGDTLAAFMTWARARSFDDFTTAALWSLSSTDGEEWTEPAVIVPGTYLEGPRQTAGNRLVLLGQGAGHQPVAFQSVASDGSGGWVEAPVGGLIGPARWPEPSLFRRPDGTLAATLRVATSERWLWAMESRDHGQSWSSPEATNFPDTPARVAAGNLPDGTAYLIGNPGLGKPALNRDVLTIALSTDGRLFDRAFVLLNNPPPLKFPGRAKSSGWQYPHAVVWGDHLYIAHSVGKEDIGVLRVNLADLPRD